MLQQKTKLLVVEGRSRNLSLLLAETISHSSYKYYADTYLIVFVLRAKNKNEFSGSWRTKYQNVSTTCGWCTYILGKWPWASRPSCKSYKVYRVILVGYSLGVDIHRLNNEVLNVFGTVRIIVSQTFEHDLIFYYDLIKSWWCRKWNSWIPLQGVCSQIPSSIVIFGWKVIILINRTTLWPVYKSKMDVIRKVLVFSPKLSGIGDTDWVPVGICCVDCSREQRGNSTQRQVALSFWLRYRYSHFSLIFLRCCLSENYHKLHCYPS